MCVCEGMYMCYNIHVEVRGKLLGNGSLFLLCGSWVLN